MRIITLLARHGTATYADAAEAIDALFARQMPEIAHDLLIIDNALPEHHHESFAPGRALIGAPNTHWEFSAWERGASWLGARMDDYDFIHLATSAFRTLYIRYLDRFDAGMLGLLRGCRAAVGHIDPGTLRRRRPQEPHRRRHARGILEALQGLAECLRQPVGEGARLGLVAAADD